jgi:hypothetical protein
MVVNTELYASALPSGIAATSSPTTDSPRSHSSFISLSSASVNVMDFFGGIDEKILSLPSQTVN